MMHFTLLAHQFIPFCGLLHYDDHLFSMDNWNFYCNRVACIALQNSAAFEKMYLLCNTVYIIYCMNCILFLQGGIYYFVCLNPVYLTYDNGTGFSIPRTLITG